MTPASISSAKSSLILRSKIFRASGSYIVSSSLFRTIHLTIASAWLLPTPLTVPFGPTPFFLSLINIRGISLLFLASRCRPRLFSRTPPLSGGRGHGRSLHQHAFHFVLAPFAF